MTHFFDHCLSRRIAEALRCLGEDVVHLRHCYPEGQAVEDPEWIDLCGEYGWAVVTCDGRIRKHSAESEALEDAGVPSIFIWGGYAMLLKWPQIAWMAKHWPTIEEALAKAKPGENLHISAVGEVNNYGKWHHEPGHLSGGRKAKKRGEELDDD